MVEQATAQAKRQPRFKDADFKSKEFSLNESRPLQLTAWVRRSYVPPPSLDLETPEGPSKYSRRRVSPEASGARR